MFNVRVEYDPAPIRHIAVECPNCKRWFRGFDIVQGDCFDVLRYDYDIEWAVFECPVCGENFGGLQNRDEAVVERSAFPVIYEGVLERKETVVWE